MGNFGPKRTHNALQLADIQSIRYYAENRGPRLITMPAVTPGFRSLISSRVRDMKSFHTLLMLFVFTSSLALAGPQGAPLKVSGIYSDLAYNAEGGDLLGLELLVIPAGEDNTGVLWNAVVQLAEGGAPYCKVVPFVVHGSRVEFTLPRDGAGEAMHFAGTISATEISLTTPAGQ